MLQPLDNPQPMYIPTRISPDVVASSRQLIPLGIVEQAGKSFYKFDTGCEWYKAIKFYPVSVIRSINQMTENEVIKIASGDTTRINMTIEPAKVVAEPVSPTINIGVAEPEQTPAPEVEVVVEAAPVVEPEPEVGAKIVHWYADDYIETKRAERDIAALEAKGWVFRGMTAVTNKTIGEYSVLYVRPQAAVSS